MSTAYLVSTGEYSYYRIRAVCLDKGEAESLAEWLGNSGGYGDGHHEVEEVDIGDGWRNGPHTDVLELRAYVYDDGEVDHRESHERWIGAPRDNNYDGPCKVTVEVGHYKRACVTVSVSGTDHERVRKVLSEQVAIAKHDWAIIMEADRLDRLRRDAEYQEWKAAHPSRPMRDYTSGSS